MCIRKTARARIGAVSALVVATALMAEGAQDRVVDRQKTSVPPESRFEIIQSINTRQTYRLDKFTGMVWLLSRVEGVDADWRPIPAPDDERQMDGRPTYQLFSSSLTTHSTYLTNVHSGRTWVLTEAPVTDAFMWKELLTKK